MARIGNDLGKVVSAVLLALALAACASTGPGMTSADPAKSAENQKRQAELQRMEAIGQRD